MGTESIASLSLGKRTDTGRVRERNEDAWKCFESEDPSVLASKGRLFVVADGMGGHTGGAVASSLAVDIVVSTYQRFPHTDMAAALRSAVQEANRQVYHVAQYEGRQGMGTTLVCAAIHNEFLWVAHVGDSRAYLFRSNKLQRLTRDHTLVNQLVDHHLLTMSEAQSHPQGHVLVRAVGHKPEVEVEVSGPISIFQGDMILLCTDGVHGMVSDDQIAAVLQDNAADAQAAADYLIAMADAAGGEDNATALVIRVDKVKQPRNSPSQGRQRPPWWRRRPGDTRIG